jgi:hypothetical protein
VTSDHDRPRVFRVWPRADVQTYEEWRREFDAFHDYHRRKFYEARGRTLAAIERIRRRAERR